MSFQDELKSKLKTEGELRKEKIEQADGISVEVIARKKFGKEEIEEPSVPGVVRVYENGWYEETFWYACVKAVAIVE